MGLKSAMGFNGFQWGLLCPKDAEWYYFVYLVQNYYFFF